MTKLEAAARNGSLVVFAGAGVSAGPPASLPGWKPLNAAIFRALRLRLETGLERKDWLVEIESYLDAERRADRFPPEYQAQVIEEMCGERYFHALQALDVQATNAAHEGIAALAAAGAIRAVVTTNFDRLIERAFDRYSVAHEAPFETESFIRLRDRLNAGGAGPTPVIKIHGSVCDPLSMIDTLKQRRKGRSRAIEECLGYLYADYWLYLGFSAADIETDHDYLGLVSGARRSSGATYVAYPGHPELGAGAQKLMDGYGAAGDVVVGDVDRFLAGLCSSIDATQTVQGPIATTSGVKEFEEKLGTWASTLSLSAAGLCLAAVMEAAGQSEPAARVLDRLARNGIYEERGTPDFQALQLQYGRLGAAFGRFLNVSDLNGAMSNASAEAVQSLLRLGDTEYAARAMGWMPCLYLWLDQGDAAMKLAAVVMRGFMTGEWGGLTLQTDEEAVDAWLAGAFVCLVNTHPTSYEVLVRTYPAALDRAKRSGDVVRTARVIALFLLAKAETKEDVPALAAQYQPQFDDVKRVGDGFASGFLALALGRWHTGPGGRALAQQTNDVQAIAHRALQHLETAAAHFRDQSMDPWLLYTAVQQAKAMSDLRNFEAVADVFNRVKPELDRFPVFASYVQEAVGQIQRFQGDPDSEQTLRAAVASAEASGLHLRYELLVSRYTVQPNASAGESRSPASDQAEAK